jgi:hypothetical protein
MNNVQEARWRSHVGSEKEKQKRLDEVRSQMKFILDTDDIKDSYGKWSCCGEEEYTAKGCNWPIDGAVLDYIWIAHASIVQLQINICRGFFIEDH